MHAKWGSRLRGNDDICIESIEVNMNELRINGQRLWNSLIDRPVFSKNFR